MCLVAKKKTSCDMSNFSSGNVKEEKNLKSVIKFKFQLVIIEICSNIRKFNCFICILYSWELEFEYEKDSDT